MADKRLETEALRSFEFEVRDNVQVIEKDIVRGRILESALETLRLRPGFNPLAISIVFGLKW